MMPPLQIERNNDSHVQLRNRYRKARRYRKKVTFHVAGERATMKSHSERGLIHYIIFTGKKLDCSECKSFEMGNCHDKNFKCYHILAAEMRWRELMGEKIR